MTQNKKNAILNVLHDYNDANLIIEKLRDLDDNKEIFTLWNQILDNETFLKLIEEQEDLYKIVEILSNITTQDVLNNDYFYFNEFDNYYGVSDVLEEIREDIKEELD